MKEDRLRKDEVKIHNLDDLLEARDNKCAHDTADTDALECDIEIPEDVDVDEALTFPHPKHKHSPAEGIELMDTPHEENMDEDWDSQDIQPTDYEHKYEEVTDTYATDDEDGIMEEQVHKVGQISMREVSKERPIEVMPGKFTPDAENEQAEPMNP